MMQQNSSKSKHSVEQLKKLFSHGYVVNVSVTLPQEMERRRS